MNPDPTSQDHDLLIELRTEMRGLREDFKSMADDTKERIVSLENNKLNKDTFATFTMQYEKDKTTMQNSLSYLTKYFWIAWGGITVLELIIGYYIAYIRK